MRLKKLVLILISCFVLASCATFDPARHPTGYKSVNDISIKDKNNSKVYIVYANKKAYPQYYVKYTAS